MAKKNPATAFDALSLRCAWRYGTAQFKLDIYMCVTHDFMDKFLMSLASYMQANH